MTARLEGWSWMQLCSALEGSRVGFAFIHLYRGPRGWWEGWISRGCGKSPTNSRNRETSVEMEGTPSEGPEGTSEEPTQAPWEKQLQTSVRVREDRLGSGLSEAGFFPACLLLYPPTADNPGASGLVPHVSLCIVWWLSVVYTLSPPHCLAGEICCRACEIGERCPRDISPFPLLRGMQPQTTLAVGPHHLWGQRQDEKAEFIVDRLLRNLKRQE